MWRFSFRRVPGVRYLQERSARQISALLVFPLVVFVFCVIYTVYEAVESPDELKIIFWGLALVCSLGICLIGLGFYQAWRGGRNTDQPSEEQQLHDVAVRDQHWFENLFRFLWSRRNVTDTESGREQPPSPSAESTANEETEAASPGTSSSQNLEGKSPSDSKCDYENLPSSSRDDGTDVEASDGTDSSLSKVREVAAQELDIAEPLLTQGKEDEGDAKIRQRKVSPPSNQALVDESGKEA